MVLEVSRSREVPAPPKLVWPDIAEGQRFAAWYAFCDAVEEPEPGVRILSGSWGSQRSSVTTAVEVTEAPHRYVWRHVEERLDGRPAPKLSLDTRVEVTLEPVGEVTEVTITSTQVPAGWLQGLLLRLLGRRQVASMLEQSLTMLAVRHGADPTGG